MIRDVIMAERRIKTLEFGPSHIAWKFQWDSCCLAHQGLFLNSYIPSLLLPFSVYLCHIDLKQNLRGSGISNKLIYHYCKSTRCKGRT